MKRSLSMSAVLDAWPETEPSAGFADRVLAAYDADVAPKKSRWPLFACALAIAVLLVPALSSRPEHQAASFAQSAELDLGLQTD